MAYFSCLQSILCIFSFLSPQIRFQIEQLVVSLCLALSVSLNETQSEDNCLIEMFESLLQSLTTLVVENLSSGICTVAIRIFQKSIIFYNFLLKQDLHSPHASIKTTCRFGLKMCAALCSTKGYLPASHLQVRPGALELIYREYEVEEKKQDVLGDDISKEISIAPSMEAEQKLIVQQGQMQENLTEPALFVPRPSVDTLDLSTILKSDWLQKQNFDTLDQTVGQKRKHDENHPQAKETKKPEAAENDEIETNDNEDEGPLWVF